MSDEEKLQSIYMEFQNVSSSIKQLEQQHEMVESHLMELMLTLQSLDEITNISPGTEILVPISSGIYAKARLENSNDFLVNIGSSITLSKDLNSTKSLIESQVDEIKKLQENIITQLQERTNKASMLEKELKQIASALEGK